MNTEALFLFLILVLGLLLCSFLGGNYIEKESFSGSFKGDFTVEQDKPKTVTDEQSRISNKYDNYNHYSGTYSHLTNGTIFYEKNGGSVKVSVQSNGEPMLVLTKKEGEIPIIMLNKQKNDKKEGEKKEVNLFYGMNGETALVIYYNGQQAVKITTDKGSRIYTLTRPSSSNTSITNPFSSNYTNYNNTPSTYYGSTGVKGANVNNSNKAFTENTSQPSMQQPQTTFDYSNSLSRGIPKSQIPPGQEDLYILKSEIVPPVCPACPASTAVCPRQEPCPPCPACARCPEPSFECKKVPNYNSINNEFLPVPVLSDFSSFGM